MINEIIQNGRLPAIHSSGSESGVEYKGKIGSKKQLFKEEEDYGDESFDEEGGDEGLYTRAGHAEEIYEDKNGNGNGKRKVGMIRRRKVHSRAGEMFEGENTKKRKQI